MFFFFFFFFLKSFCNHLKLTEEGIPGYFTFIVFLPSCGCLCSVSLPHGVVDCMRSMIVVFPGQIDNYIGSELGTSIMNVLRALTFVRTWGSCLNARPQG